MKEFNGLVVGLGDWGSRVAREYAYLAEEGALGKIYLAEPKKEQLEKFKTMHKELIQKLGNKIKFIDIDVTKIDKATVSDINVAHICVNNKFHYPIAKFLMENGISVIIEKPVSESIEEANELIEIAKKNNVVAKAGLIFRFDNSIKKIKEIYDSKQLGKVYFMRFTWEFSRKPMENVDIVWDLTPHLIDIYSFFTGHNAAFVTGLKTQFRRNDKAELANVVLTNQANIKAILEISWFSTAKTRTIEIFGEKKIIRADILAQTITLFETDDILKSEQLQIVKNNTIREEALNLIENAKTGKNTVNPIEIGVNETKLIDEINRNINSIK